MTEEILKRGKFLYLKLMSLINNKNMLVKAKDITDVYLTINPGDYKYKYVKIDIQYLEFNKFKTFLLEEINREIAETQKEFDEL